MHVDLHPKVAREIDGRKMGFNSIPVEPEPQGSGGTLEENAHRRQARQSISG